MLESPSLPPAIALLDYASPAEIGAFHRPSRAVALAILLLVTLIWGTTFVATRLLVAGDQPALAPGALIFWRFLVAALIFPFYQGVYLTCARFWSYSSEIIFAAARHDDCVPPRGRRALFGREAH